MAINRGNDYIAKFPRGKLQYSHLGGGLLYTSYFLAGMTRGKGYYITPTARYSTSYRRG